MLHGRFAPIVTGTPIESGVSLGGLGCGGIEIWPDGTFRYPQFLNCAPWIGRHAMPSQPEFRPEDLFFLLRVKRAGKAPQLRFLMVGHGKNFVAMGNLSRTYKYASIPTVQSIHFQATYPLVELAYVDDRLPVEVTLQAWTPFIPHDHLESSTPGAVFDFRIRNLCDESVEVSLVYACANLAGWESVPSHRQEVIHASYGTGVVMTGGSDPTHATTGQTVLFAAECERQRTTAVAANPYLENLIQPIYFDGDLSGPLRPEHIKREELHGFPFEPGANRDKGWICVQRSLSPDEADEIRFGLAWHFPNHTDSFGRFAGHFYTNLFDDAPSVAWYLLQHADLLKERSVELPNRMANGTLPETFALSLLDQLSMLTKSSWLTKDGRFFLWEGLGCCCLNTVDVQHYASFGLACLFPELQKCVDRWMAETQNADGHIAHGTAGVSSEDIPEGEYKRWDVNAQFILSLYRDWRWTGDDALLRDLYDIARKTFELLQRLDCFGDGLPDIDGGITYDHWHMQGTVTYMCGLYLAACRAMSEMARHKEDVETHRWADDAYCRGVKAFERLLWSEGQYLLFHRRTSDPTPTLPLAEASCSPGCGCVHPDRIITIEQNNGLHTDALNGDAYAQIVGLGPLLCRDRVHSFIRKVLEHNVHPELGFLVNGTYRDDNSPDEWPFSQWQNPWTGTEYFFAAGCFAEGLVKEGLRVIDNVYRRLSAEGMRFNHIECDEHYARPLSLYAAYLAYLGFDYDVSRGRLRLHPVAECSAPFLTPIHTGWIEYKADGLTLTIDSGESTLCEFESPFGTVCDVWIDDEPVTYSVVGDAVALTLPTRLTKGVQLRIKPPS